MSNNQNTIEKIVNLAKARGFVYAGSEIYGGLANTWDYGPLGSILKDNIRDLWKKEFIQRDPNAYAVDAGILMHPRVWKASGHVDGFQDPLFDCKDCKKRFRADKVIEEYIYKREKQGKPLKEKIIVDAMSEKEMEEFIKVQGINCPQCGKNNFTEIRQFKLMFSTKRGVTEENTNEIYLRPETAQGQFVNFTNIVRSQRARVPFAAVQIGKAFRNEITPGNFLFRTIEFEQMEYQLFVKPGTDEEFYETMKKRAMNFYIKLGIDRKKLRFKDHDKLIFYAKAATDVHYEFPFGWDEITGVHNRTNYDLSRHQEFSTKSQEYTDPITNEIYLRPETAQGQ
ncbi:MAG: glycine--tRNA ligase, partial [Firmicutes bacterium]|nr:glycine--tRNA ligase [Bacillota bacterium]